MVSAFKANDNNEEDIAESDGDEALHLKWGIISRSRKWDE